MEREKNERVSQQTSEPLSSSQAQQNGSTSIREFKPIPRLNLSKLKGSCSNKTADALKVEEKTSTIASFFSPPIQISVYDEKKSLIQTGKFSSPTSSVSGEKLRGAINDDTLFNNMLQRVDALPFITAIVEKNPDCKNVVYQKIETRLGEFLKTIADVEKLIEAFSGDDCKWQIFQAALQKFDCLIKTLEDMETFLRLFNCSRYRNELYEKAIEQAKILIKTEEDKLVAKLIFPADFKKILFGNAESEQKVFVQPRW